MVSINGYIFVRVEKCDVKPIWKCNQSFKNEMPSMAEVHLST